MRLFRQAGFHPCKQHPNQKESCCIFGPLSSSRSISFLKGKAQSAMAEHLPTMNIPEMDRQHQELHAAVLALKESPKCVEELGHIIDAVEAHFQAEETLFEQYQIPNVITHRSEHKKFLALLRKTHEEWRTKDEANEDLSTDVEQIVKSTAKWLKIHTSAYDAPQYGTFFKDGEYIGKVR